MPDGRHVVPENGALVHYTQLGQLLDRNDPHIGTVLAGIRNTHGRPPRQKEAVLRDDVVAMIETLDRGALRGLWDRAMLLVGFAGGLRRSELVGLDVCQVNAERARSIDATDRGLRSAADAPDAHAVM
jgi:integrase